MGIFDNLKNKVNFDELKDKVKFDELKDKAVDLANSGVAKSKTMADIAKLKTSSMAAEDAVKKAYIAIGKAVYDALETGAEAEIEAFVEKIKENKALIADNAAKIAELKNAGTVSEEEVAAVEALASTQRLDLPKHSIMAVQVCRLQ